MLILVENFDNLDKLKGILLSTFREGYLGLDMLKLSTKEIEMWFHL